LRHKLSAFGRMAMFGTRLIAVVMAGAFAIHAEAAEPCMDLKASKVVQFEGTLTRKIFAGPPNYEDVRKGDRPEPAYILQLKKPICVAGDEFIGQDKLIDRVQIFPEYEEKENKALVRALRGSIGKVVAVEGVSPFGAHTGHHHAPLLLPISKITAPVR